MDSQWFIAYFDSRVGDHWLMRLVGNVACIVITIMVNIAILLGMLFAIVIFLNGIAHMFPQGTF